MILEAAVACDPSRPGYQVDLIEAYRMDWRLDEALAACRRALERWPEDLSLRHELHLVLYDRDELDEAVAELRQLIARDPDQAGAHMRLGQIHLIRGEGTPGWAEYEWRFRLPGLKPMMPPTSQPKWNGANARDGTLLVVCAEGFGDTIMFARYIPQIAQRCRTLLIACSAEMAPLLAQQPGIAAIVQKWAEVPAYDAWCMLSSAPGIFGTDVVAPPAPIPYILADKTRIEVWRERLDSTIPAGLQRVGVVWAGRPTHPNDRRRSMDFGSLFALTGVPGIALVGMQKGRAAPTLPEFRGPAPFVDCSSELTDFVDTAALVENLDLVISVDTAIAHLAAAMGKPVWLLLPFAADWRWRRGRDDTPWYPTMQLIRQPRPGDWNGAIETAIRYLREILQHCSGAVRGS